MKMNLPDAIAAGTRVEMNKHVLEFGKNIREFRSSNDILGDFDALRARYAEDGYLLIRRFHDRQPILDARLELLRELQDYGMLKPGAPLEDGEIAADAGSTMFKHEVAYDRLPAVLDVVNSDRLMKFFSGFLQGPARTLDFKWLRATAPGGFAGLHYDRVYMGRGTRDLYTCWIPYGDVPLEMGPLLLLLGSQDFEKVKATYGEMDVDIDKVQGSFSNDPFEVMERYGGQFVSGNFQVGDIIIFGMFLMHGSLSNTTSRYRLSSDTRYQLASEPADDRWIGENPKQHYGWNTGNLVDMDESRSKWGV